MRKLIDIEVTEKEWRHIQARYRDFNKTHKRCNLDCPMGWTTVGPNYDHIKANELLNVKITRVPRDTCLCSQFSEFAKSRKEQDCPCNVYSGDQAFRQLAKLIKRWEKEDGNSG